MVPSTLAGQATDLPLGKGFLSVEPGLRAAPGRRRWDAEALRKIWLDGISLWLTNQALIPLP